MTKTALTVLGLAIALVGFFWAGQGAGIVNFPSGSMMLAQTKWVFIGGAVALAGLALIYASRRR